jgi:hypothetical protein
VFTASGVVAGDGASPFNRIGVLRPTRRSLRRQLVHVSAQAAPLRKSPRQQRGFATFFNDAVMMVASDKLRKFDTRRLNRRRSMT